MDNANGFVLAAFTALTGAVGWLAKRLYDAPRPDDHAKLVEDCKAMRIIIDNAAEETARQRGELSEKNRALEVKLAKLESAIARRTRATDEQA